MKELVSKIQANIEAFNLDAKNFVEKGNKAAAQRARKVSLEIEKLMKEFRKKSVNGSKE